MAADSMSAERSAPNPNPKQPDQGHTPTPWHTRSAMGWSIDDEGGNQLAICRGNYSATTPHGDTDNAAFIVRCVNSHGALVKALRDLLVAALDCGARPTDPEILQANAALSLATSPTQKE